MQTKTRTSSVYVIRCPNPPALKFGHSSRVLSRFSTLQVASPVDLELLGYQEFGDAGAVEEQIHLALASFRLRGEWFKQNAVVLGVARALLEEPRAAFLEKLRGMVEREMERRRLDAFSGYASCPIGQDKVDLHIVRKV